MIRWLDVLRLRVRSLLRRDRVDRELDRELRFHLEHRVAELVADGRDPRQARDEALREFGSPSSITEQCRDTRRVARITTVVDDVRYAARVLRAQPMLLVAATCSIGLGVGVNLSIFALANDLLLSTPTARAPESLVHIRTTEGSHTSTPTWRALEASDILEGLAGHRLDTDVIWRGGDQSSTLSPLIVTANFFEVVGVPVAVGRGFTAGEAAAEREPRLAVLGDRFWRSRLGADPSIVGQAITLNGAPYTVIGVLAPNLRSLPGYGITPDVVLPQSQALVPNLEGPRGSHVQLIGRLRAGQTPVQAQVALSTVAAQVGQDADIRDLSGIRLVAPVGSVEQLREFKEIAAFFGVLLVVTLLVLAIACANVAGLLLARATARTREIALRLALGATRGRLIQQLLTEGLLLSLVGAAAGLTLTWLLGRVIAGQSLPLPLPIEFHFRFDTRLAWLAGGLVMLSTLFCGLAPALQATRPTLAPALKQELARYGHRRLTARTLLVAAEVAVSVLLLVMTSLFLRNLTMARGLSPGFDADRAVLAQVTFVEGRQGTAQAPAVAAILERIRALPDIESVAFSEGVPLTMRYGGETGTEVRIDRRTELLRVEYFSNAVGPGYFATLGLRVVRGRDFSLADCQGAPRVMVVNEEFARRYFNGEDPIGRRIAYPSRQNDVPALVIGVVSDSKYRSIGEDREAAVYFASLQSDPDRFVHVLARTAGSPESATTALRAAVAAADPSAAVTVEPMRSALSFAFLPSRIGAILVGALGLLGGLLAMVGLYGVISFAVGRRTSEIGIRMALGASRPAVVRLVLGDSGVLVGIGIAAGLGIALLATLPLRAFLVADLATTDSFSYLATAGVLAATSLVACWGPARRASRLSPVTALRVE